LLKVIVEVMDGKTLLTLRKDYNAHTVDNSQNETLNSNLLLKKLNH